MGLEHSRYLSACCCLPPARKAMLLSWAACTYTDTGESVLKTKHGPWQFQLSVQGQRAP